MAQRPSYKHLNIPESNNSKNAKTHPENVPSEAIAAREARLISEIRGFFWVKEFAVAVGRRVQYISDKCHAGEIKTMRGGKPYRIPYSEYESWLRPNG